MGVVYEVEHVHTGQRLALKALSSQPRSSVERFKREARAASLIRSDHIVLVTDADVAPELDGAPFLVMELHEGSDLERATGGRPVSPAEVITWLRQVARALGKAHEAGLVHRDLKPENLFLTRREDGTPLVKLLDFGIAKMTLEGPGLTSSDAFLGTPGYMAPEQMDSKGPPITPRADLFALGLIAFKLLTGRSYWISGTLVQLLAQILAEPMPPASERGANLGPEFDAWFAKACDRDPQKRFASAEEQVQALAQALGGVAEVTREAEPRVRWSAPTLAVGEKQDATSLNGSSRELQSTRRKITRQRVLGGAVVAAVVGIGVAASVLHDRGTVPAQPTPPTESHTVARSVPLPPVPPEPAASSEPQRPPEAQVASAPPATSASAAAPAAPSRAPAKAPPRRVTAASVTSMPSAAPAQATQPPVAPTGTAPAETADPLAKLKRL